MGNEYGLYSGESRRVGNYYGSYSLGQGEWVTNILGVFGDFSTVFGSLGEWVTNMVSTRGSQGEWVTNMVHIRRAEGEW